MSIHHWLWMIFLFLSSICILGLRKRLRQAAQLRTRLQIGSMGEDETIRRLERLRGYKRILRNLYVPLPDGCGTTEIDAVIVHEKGIFVLENKNYSGRISGDGEDCRWTQVRRERRRKWVRHFYNPIRQNRGHIRCLQAYLPQDLSCFWSVVTFNDQAKLKHIRVASEDVLVANSRKVRKKLQRRLRWRRRVLSRRQVQEICEMLQPLAHPKKRVVRQHKKQLLHRGRLLLACLAACSLLNGCGLPADGSGGMDRAEAITVQEAPGGLGSEAAGEKRGAATAEFPDAGTLAELAAENPDAPYIHLNGNLPYFTEADHTTEEFEFYSELDGLGRCGQAYACIGIGLMPTEERGQIGSVKPSGWHTVKYDIVDGKYLYNRCHLIGYQLAGENANEKNLITGTRYLNVTGMLPFENDVADYVKETGQHVLYRVTPIYIGDNLLADGVVMEGLSIEDNGAGICFAAYVPNRQPGITIDYATGESWLADSTGTAQGHADGTASVNAGSAAQEAEAYEEFVLNTSSKKFHLPDCGSVATIKETNKESWNGPRSWLIEHGYEPCGSCKP